MSKMDGLRAMREARYAENTARAKTAAPAAKKAPAKKAAPKRTSAAKAVAPSGSGAAEQARPTDAADAGLCGHRAISGRTCTREKGHAAKSHRYS